MNELQIRAICNPVRLKLIACIGTHSKSVTQLISNCGLSQSAVSQHLAKLRRAKLLNAIKQGREVKYSLTNTKLEEVSKLILNL